MRVVNKTTLHYNGVTMGDFNDFTTMSATLARQVGAVPVVGATVGFSLNGTETCIGVTDASGHASCSVTPGEAAGSYSASAAFAGRGTDLPSSTTATFIVNHEDTALALTGPIFVANGGSLTLSATLTDPVSAGEAEPATPISGKSITFTLGSGAGVQTCSGTTTSAGLATCNIATVNQPLGITTITAFFAGDSYDQAASASTSTLAYAYLSHGAFVLGDKSSTIGATVTFWSSSWSSVNKLSGGQCAVRVQGLRLQPFVHATGCWRDLEHNRRHKREPACDGPDVHGRHRVEKCHQVRSAHCVEQRHEDRDRPGVRRVQPRDEQPWHGDAPRLLAVTQWTGSHWLVELCHEAVLPRPNRPFQVPSWPVIVELTHPGPDAVKQSFVGSPVSKALAGTSITLSVRPAT